MTSPAGPPDFQPPDFPPPDLGPPDLGPPDFQPPDFEPPRVEPVQLQPAAYQQSPAAPPAAPPRPGRRAAVVVLVALATVLVVLVAADRLAPRLIGDRVASTLQTELGSDRPVVRFGGFPFLTQVATRRYRRISVIARNVPVTGTAGRLTVDEFDGTLTDVRPDASYRTITVGHFSGSATLGYSHLTSFVGTPVSYDRSGSNGAGFVTMALGGEITMIGKPALDAQSNQLYLVRTQFRIAGRLLPGSPPSDLSNQLFRFPLPEMLAGTHLTAVQARPNGLVLTGSGNHITLRR